MRLSGAFRMASTPRIVSSRICISRVVVTSSVAAIWTAVVSLSPMRLCLQNLLPTAPPFHPEGQRPKAPCPTCLREKKDGDPRDLYSIRGFQKSEHDPMIPPAWFVAPPMSFEGNGKEIEALRV
jgi:hypothetical protein